MLCGIMPPATLIPETRENTTIALEQRLRRNRKRGCSLSLQRSARRSLSESGHAQHDIDGQGGDG